MARPLSKTTLKVVMLGREKDTPPFLTAAATMEAVGLIDTASETKLFNDEQALVQDPAGGQ